MAKKTKAEILRAPLCPAGHLPHKGGDWRFRRSVHSCDVGDWRRPARQLISLGEMSGRTEGGRCPSSFSNGSHSP
ncbi:hypothetical protein EOD07_19430, partial [Mesorhizobium sp. M2C.T.Ca.TU.002.02.1.1]